MKTGGSVNFLSSPTITDDTDDAFLSKKNQDIYSSLTVSHFSVTVQNTQVWKMRANICFPKKKKKNHSCPEHGQSRHNQRQWSTMKPAPEYETVRQFNSAITNRLQYLIGSILCALVKNLPLVWMDDVVFSSYSKQENPLFLLFPAKLLNTFWLFKISHQPLKSQICWLCFWWPHEISNQSWFVLCC